MPDAYLSPGGSRHNVRFELGEQLPVVGVKTSAASIARPKAPSSSEATAESLIAASWSTVSSRCASRERSWIFGLR